MTSLRDFLFHAEPGVEIYCGDNRQILPLLETESMDLIVTDPPYGMNRFATDGKSYLEQVGPALQSAFSLLKDGGSMFVFTSTGEVVKVALAVDQPLRRMFWLYKPNDCTYPLHGWLLKSEAILWFTRGEKPIFAERRPYRHDTYIHTRVGLEGVNGHPTVKPLEVISDFVSRCPEDGLILDPFLGSGTTLEAAKIHRRRAIGIEIEPKYCELAVRRLRQEVLPL